MKYNLDRIIDRRGTNSLKWEYGRMANPKVGEDVLPLWVADMDFQCADEILDAIRLRLDREILGYSVHETDQYYDAVTGWMSRRFGWDVAAGDIFAAPGVVPAVGSLIRALTGPGDGVIIQQPVYGPFAESIRRTGRVLVDNPLVNDGGYYRMDFDDLRIKAADPANKMMILCSPHNPVGRVWTEDELRRVGEICLENGVIPVSDEIHFDIVREGVRHRVLETLFPGEKGIITCTAPSKTFNLAGMQASNIIIRDDDYKRRWLRETGHLMLSPLSIAAVTAAYNGAELWLSEVNSYIDKNLRFISDFLDENLPEAVYRVPEGTYLAWVDLSAFGLSGNELTDYIIDNAGVFFNGGNKFGREGGGFQRINAACPRPVLQEALIKTADALKKLRG